MIWVMGIWRRDRRALNLESEPGTFVLGRWNPVFFYFGFAPEVWLQGTPPHPAGTFRIFNGKCSTVALRPGDPGLPAPQSCHRPGCSVCSCRPSLLPLPCWWAGRSPWALDTWAVIQKELPTWPSEGSKKPLCQPVPQTLPLVGVAEGRAQGGLLLEARPPSLTGVLSKHFASHCFSPHLPSGVLTEQL